MDVYVCVHICVGRWFKTTLRQRQTLFTFNLVDFRGHQNTIRLASTVFTL